MLKIGVLASGRGSNFQSIVDSVKRGEIEARIELVISDKRKAMVLKRARKHGIDAIFLDPGGFSSREDFEKGLSQKFDEKGVDLVLMAGFMRILSTYFIKKHRGRIMNIHPSLLPAFTGLKPQKQALDYGVKLSGCTVHFADEGMDTGPIILQAAVPVREGDTEETLAERILKEEHLIYPEAVRLFSRGLLKIEGRRVKILKETESEDNE